MNLELEIKESFKTKVKTAEAVVVWLWLVPQLKLWVNEMKYKVNPQLQLWESNRLKLENFNHFNGFLNLVKNWLK